MSEAPIPATSELTAAVALVAEFVAAFPDLPAPRVLLHPHSELGVALQLERACDVEAWRQALGIHPAALELHAYAGGSWLEATVNVGPVRVQMTGDVPTPGHVAAVSPQEDARLRAARLDVQRHELFDPAEPPAAYTVTVPAAEAPEVMSLADMPGGAA